MSNLHLVTGYAGEAHITSADQGSFNAALLGNGEFVLERGNQFAASIITNNQVRVLDGDLMMQGRHIRLNENTYVDLNFDNGTQGYKRIDLIVARYTKDSTTDIESAELVVIKGTPSESDAIAPEHVTGDIINEQALQNDVVLYQVPFDGINMQELVQVFSTVETLETMKQKFESDIDAKFSDLQKTVRNELENFEIPIVSDIEEMKLIESYGEFTADAKSVGELDDRIGFWLSGTIAAESDSVTITDSRIVEDTILQPFVNSVEVTGRITAISTGSVTITLDDVTATEIAVRVKGVNL